MRQCSAGAGGGCRAGACEVRLGTGGADLDAERGSVSARERGSRGHGRPDVRAGGLELLGEVGLRHDEAGVGDRRQDLGRSLGGPLSLTSGELPGTDGDRCPRHDRHDSGYRHELRIGSASRMA